MVMANPKYIKPYYGIKLDLAQIGVDIRLNDIPVYYDNDKGQLTVDLPASGSVIDGNNELSISVFTPFIDESHTERMDKLLPGSLVTAELYVQELDDPTNKKETLTILSIKVNSKHIAEVVNFDENNPINITNSSDNTITATQNVNISSPFPRWKWQDGMTITNTKENFDSLLLAYKEIYAALSEKNKPVLLDLYKLKAKEAAISYHLPVDDGHKKISTGEDMENPELELYTFWEKDMILDVYANGKLARIIGDTAPSIQPIIYLDRSAGILHKHKFGFYKSDQGKWTLAR